MFDSVEVSGKVFSKMRSEFVLLLISVLFIGKSYSQLRCYACSYSSVDSDQSCMTISDDSPIVNCPHTYCIIMRQEFTDPAGVVASFVRGCEEQPDYLNHEIQDPTFTTYYRACTNDLCNIGDGIQSVIGGSLSPSPVYEGDNLLVPGTGASSKIIPTGLVSIFLAGLLGAMF